MKLVVDNTKIFPVVHYWAIDYCHSKKIGWDISQLYCLGFRYLISNQTMEYYNFSGTIYDALKNNSKFGTLESLASDLDFASRQGFNLQINGIDEDFWQISKTLFGQFRLYNDFNTQPVNLIRKLDKIELSRLRNSLGIFVPQSVSPGIPEVSSYSQLRS